MMAATPWSRNHASLRVKSIFFPTSRLNHGFSKTGRPYNNASQYRPRSPNQIPAKLLPAAQGRDTMLFTTSSAAPSTATSSNTNADPKISNACHASELVIATTPWKRGRNYRADNVAWMGTCQMQDQLRIHAASA